MAIWDDIYNAVKRVVDFVQNVQAIILQPLADFTRSIGSWVNDVVMSHAQWLSGLIGNVGSAVQGVYTNLVNWLGGAIAAIVNAVNSVTATIYNFISSGFSIILNFVQTVLSYLWSMINGIVATFSNAVQSVVSTVASLLTNTVSQFTIFVRDTYNTIQTIITSTTNTIMTRAEAFEKNILAWTIDRVAQIQSGVGEVITGLPDALTSIASVLNNMGNLVPDLNDAKTIKTVISTLMRTMEELLGNADAFTLHSEPKAIMGLEAVAAGIGFWIGSPFGVVPFLTDSYKAYFGDWIDSYGKYAAQANHMSPSELSVAKRRELITQDYFYEQTRYQGLGDTAITAVSELSRQFLSPSEMATARRRREMTPDRYFKSLGWLGLSGEDSETLYNITRQYFTPFEAGNLWLRGKIDDAKLDEQLRGNGVSDDDLPNWRELYLALPTPADVVHMAVREVFTPATAEKFGQYLDIPDGFLPMARKVGLSEEVAKMYWAAHWELPSVQMGYEMLHRGIIEPPELDMLMKALDIMPFWRPKLVQMSYNPLTRVDIRRMQKLGLLTREQTVKAHKDLGYDDEKAEWLTLFTERYNKNPEYQDMTEADTRQALERDRSKEDWLSGYSMGLINQTDAGAGLDALGYDETERAYYLAREDYKKAKKVTDKYIEYCHDAYIKGVNTLNEVVDQLASLNLPGETVDELTQGWQIERTLRVAKPTKSEILGWLKRKLMTAVEAADELRGLGYNDKYVNLYLTQT
ncbi:hypothetical protein MUP79_09945 [Candidatus Bathyarchaeota archaeon]|nr:hypothetical protein [Candidatus Bathyarchaeota archaeon]